jgi:predicted CXXCH cytochrome family protein
VGPESSIRPNRARRAWLAAAAGVIIAAPAFAPTTGTTPALSRDIAAVPDRVVLGWSGGDCLTCHENEAAWSHPVGIVPSMPVPSDLPLLHGQLACITCHDNRHSADHARARMLHEPLLRADSAAELCAGCHDPLGTGRRDMHATMLGRAHLRRLADIDAGPGTGDPSAASPDPASRVCLGCHDGSVAHGVADASGPPGPARPGPSAHAPIGASHPIGAPYRAHPDQALRPADSLDPRIRLFDGRVGCGSCHNLYAGGRSLLVMSNTGSRLCLSCHEF